MSGVTGPADVVGAGAGKLSGRTVVVTRPAGGPDALADRLRELGAEVRALPALALEAPSDPRPLDAALGALDRFDWVVLASAACVDRVLARMGELGIPVAALAARALAAVGPVTAARLAAGVRAPDLVPDQATGAALAAALAPRVRGRRVLLPRPAEGRPELAEGLASAGAEVTAVEAYRTAPAPPALLAPLAAWLRAGEVDVVALASPSAVLSVTAALGPDVRLLERALLATIGPTTAEALRAQGLSPGVMPACHTGRDLADAIAARLAAR